VIVRLPERSLELESAMSGRFWRVKAEGGVIYVVKGGIPEGVASALPEGSCLDIKGSTPLTSRELVPGGTRVRIGDAEFGGERIVVCAGPCAVESREQLFDCHRGP